MHYTLPWFLPFDDQETRQTGITLNYEFAGADLIGGIGYATNKFPWIAGVQLQSFGVYFGQDYFANGYSVLGSLSLNAPFNLFSIGATALYNFDDTYVVSALLTTKLFEIYHKFDGNIFYAYAKTFLGSNSIILDGSYDFDYGDINVDLTYDTTKDYAISARVISSNNDIGLELNFKKYIKDGYLKFSVDSNNVTDMINKTYISVSGEINF